MNKQARVFKLLWPEKCWHEASGMVWICGNCKTDAGWNVTMRDSVPVESLNPDLTTWEGFGLMWTRAQEMDWWDEFRLNHCQIVEHGDLYDWPEDLINPERFLDALDEFAITRGM